jgi:PHD/YefM family antitoxin component YafN of YafNO toxin-antitoxin module
MNQNTVSVAEIKRRGMAAIDDCLRRGPVHIIKRNKMAAVVLSEDDYQRLTSQQPVAPSGMTAIQWLLAHSTATTNMTAPKRSKDEIDAALQAERAW